MRFTATLALIAAVAADEWEDSHATSVDFASDNADEKASLTFKTTMEDDVKNLAGDFTISSKATDLNTFKFTVGLRSAETVNKCDVGRYTIMSSGNIGGDDTYTVGSRASKADQINCGNSNEIQ